MLHRKIRAAESEHEFDVEEAKQDAEAVLDRLEHLGVLNDRTWLEHKVRAGIRKGHSPAKIRAAVGSKGIDQSLVDELLAESDVDPTLMAACTFIRKRRMGAFANRERDAERDLAKLGRAGFPWSIARKVLDMSLEELEEIVYAA